MERTYICIDLKSFYASVECRERNLDPLTTNLVVADNSRTEKTICLAVTPSLKKYGIPGRARLFEVNQKVREINYKRRSMLLTHKFTGKSYSSIMLDKYKTLELDFIIAPPRMKFYMDYSTRIYNVYLKYIAPEDIFVYSIDEVFCDVTNYLETYNMSAVELITTMIKDVYETTGITATGGIGTNLYLAKVAMDVVAKHAEANEFGVRIGSLDVLSYRKKLWEHKPLTDFWRVGKGYVKRLNQHGIYTMGDICKTSLENEDLLYKMFGVNAELLIDHAWGVEPCLMKDIKTYKPSCNSLGSGQVLHDAYNYEKTKLIVKEMTDLLVLDLSNKNKVTDKIVLTLTYDISNLDNKRLLELEDFEIVVDVYGRSMPKPSHGTYTLDFQTSSCEVIMDGVLKLFDRIANKNLLYRKVNITFQNIVDKDKALHTKCIKQLDLFSEVKEEKVDEKSLEEEKRLQEVIFDIKKKYGKNAILKGMNLEDGATTIDRNGQVGGHKA